MRILLAAVAGALLLVLPGGAGAQSPTLFGTVGPGFLIRLQDAAGNPVTHLDPGTYTIQVADKGDIHNFHLTGPGVDMATDIEQVATVTWTVTLTNGVYHYQCDAHPTVMRGDVTVGTASPPLPSPLAKPKPVALAAGLGPGAKISVTRAGARLKAIKAGPVVITVNDRSAKDNFHLVGPAVNRRTSKLGKARVTWKLTLKRGLYTYRSDATPSLKGSFRVT